MAIYITTISVNDINDTTILVNEKFLTKDASGNWKGKDKLNASELRAFLNYVKAFETSRDIAVIEKKIAQIKEQYNAIEDKDWRPDDKAGIVKFYQEKLTKLTKKLNELRNGI